jgi:ferritin
MIKEKIEKAFNEQIKAEFDSAYLYMAMAADFEEKNWDGFAKWMEKQAAEEMSHGMKFYKHIIERGGKVELMEIAKPQQTWDSHIDALEATLKHEKYITGRIHKLMELSEEEHDFESRSMLQWFIDEQVEEEASAEKILETLKQLGDKGAGMIMLDRELGRRE